MPRKVKLYHYQLPLDCAMILRGQSISVREGWLLELQESAELQDNVEHVQCNSTQINKIGRGEIAPLPGFSDETAAQAKQQLDSVIKIWLAQGDVDLSACSPSVAFGFSMALLELDSGLPQMTLDDGNQNYAGSALLLPADLRLIKTKHSQLATTSLCKLKIASQPTVAAARHDGEIARLLLQQYPQLRLRLDANQRWDLNCALAFANPLPTRLRQRIDFIEEPCSTPSECLQFARETGIAIAWDESLRDADKNQHGQGALELITSAADGLGTANITAIVIKPMLTGSISRCQELIEQAHQQAVTVVISSSLESSFGLQQLARLSQWLTPNTVPGLDTAHVFKQQLTMPWEHI